MASLLHGDGGHHASGVGQHGEVGGWAWKRSELANECPARSFVCPASEFIDGEGSDGLWLLEPWDELGCLHDERGKFGLLFTGFLLLLIVE